MSTYDLPVVLLPGVPAVRTGSGWWLSSAAGAIRVTDAELSAELECAAGALALAHQAVDGISPDDGAQG